MIVIKWDEKQCGIYYIRHKDSQKVYVGSSVNCYHRIKSQHLAKLRKGIHTNPHLQAAFRKYGEKAFEYFVVEECEEEEMLQIEQKHFELTRCLDRQFGYNINPNAEKTELTKEQCEKIRIAKLGKRRTNKRQVGVFRSDKRWIARIGFYREDIYLGSFLSQRKAKEVYEAALEKVKAGKRPTVSEERVLKDKPVIQRTLEGEFIKRFPSLRSVEKEGYSQMTVWSYC
ncbi:hypothetical protein LCGC14_2437140, partial [marine sediment metagenome]